MQSDLYPICYYLSGALSSKGDLSYRVHRLGSLQFRSGCKILFQVLPYNFFDLLFILFFVCVLFKPCLQDKSVISLWELLFCSFTVVSECLKNANVTVAVQKR